MLTIGRRRRLQTFVSLRRWHVTARNERNVACRYLLEDANRRLGARRGFNIGKNVGKLGHRATRHRKQVTCAMIEQES